MREAALHELAADTLKQENMRVDLLCQKELTLDLLNEISKGRVTKICVRAYISLVINYDPDYIKIIGSVRRLEKDPHIAEDGRIRWTGELYKVGGSLRDMSITAALHPEKSRTSIEQMIQAVANDVADFITNGVSRLMHHDLMATTMLVKYGIEGEV